MSTDDRAALIRERLRTYTEDWGMFVIPIYELDAAGRCTCGRGDSCESPGKHPRQKAWPKKATDQWSEAEKWLEKWPHTNLAVVAGLSDLVCVDVDGRNGGEDSLCEWEATHGEFPETIRAISGSGCPHILFRHPGGETRVKSHALTQGIDIKADGGYFLVEPSNHVSGRDYAWDSGFHPSETKLAPLPESILTAMASQRVEHATVDADVRSGIIGEAFAQCMALGRRLGPGKAAAICPNEKQHSSGRRFDSSTVVFSPKPGSHLGYFWCSHSHCKHLCGNWNILGFLPKEAVEAAKRKLLPPSSDPEWPTPLPLDPTSEVPEFPVQTLPPVLQHWVLAEAEATQTPPDLAAMLVLGVLAATVAKLFETEVLAGWREPLNLFVAVAMPPASRKSAVFADACTPLRQVEEAEIEATRARIAEAAVRLEMLQTQAKKAKARAAKTGRGEDQQEAVSLEIESRAIDVPVEPQRLADDITPEQLAVRLAAQGGRMAVMSSEGGIFQILAGRYSDGVSNLDVFLKGHSGDELRVDRIKRDALRVSRPALTVCLAVQPSIIQGLTSQTSFRGTGLLARFLFSLPAPTVGTRRYRDVQPMPSGIRRAYHELIHDLASLERRGPAGAIATQTLQLTEAAQERMTQYLERLEPRLGSHGDLRAISDWGGKLAGTVVRIASLLTFAAGEPAVTERHIEAAGDIGEYLIHHALAAFGTMGEDQDLQKAKLLLEWVRRKGLRRFTKRDVLQSMRGTFRNVAALSGPLNLLEEFDWVKLEPPDPNRKAGRPAMAFLVSPAALS